MKRFIIHPASSGRMRDMNSLQRVQHLVGVTGDYPLEVGLAIWAGCVGFVSLLWDPPSSSLAQLPNVLDTTWAVVMLVGSVATAYGLWVRLMSPAIANAMFLFSVAFAAYSVTVISISGWSSGGAVGGLTTTLSVVCYLRSRRLRELWKILLAEGEKLHRTGSLPVVKDSGYFDDRPSP
jgi:hypothetical protein